MRKAILWPYRESQSPQIGSWFQLKKTFKGLPVRTVKSQSPQIGSWFQSAQETTADEEDLELEGLNPLRSGLGFNEKFLKTSQLE